VGGRVVKKEGISWIKGLVSVGTNKRGASLWDRSFGKEGERGGFKEQYTYTRKRGGKIVRLINIEVGAEKGF